MKKSSKSQSGVLVITVLTSPYPKFGNKVRLVRVGVRVRVRVRPCPKFGNKVRLVRVGVSYPWP